MPPNHDDRPSCALIYKGPLGNSLCLMVQVESCLEAHNLAQYAAEMKTRAWIARSREALVEVLLEYVDSPKEEA